MVISAKYDKTNVNRPFPFIMFYKEGYRIADIVTVFSALKGLSSKGEV